MDTIPSHLGDISVELLADRPDLVTSLARMRWQEWADGDEHKKLEEWVEVTRREAGRDGLPVTLVATISTDPVGKVAGGVGIIPTEYPELSDRGPWVVGTIVRADRRGRGIGSVLLAQLRQWAADAGIERLWVATGPAAGFYRRCGFALSEVATLANGDRVTVLSARI